MEDTTILLVEDHPDDVFLTLNTLKKKHIRNVVVKHEARDALNYLFGAANDEGEQRNGLPDLILLDLRLPQIDGFEFLEAVRADELTRDIPVIVLSSSKYERDLDRCHQLGITAYFTKPLNIDEFIEITKIFSKYKSNSLE